jgi:hypothetical protein
LAFKPCGFHGARTSCSPSHRWQHGHCRELLERRRRGLALPPSRFSGVEVARDRFADFFPGAFSFAEIASVWRLKELSFYSEAKERVWIICIAWSLLIASVKAEISLPYVTFSSGGVRVPSEADPLASN